MVNDLHGNDKNNSNPILDCENQFKMAANGKNSLNHTVGKSICLTKLY